MPSHCLALKRACSVSQCHCDGSTAGVQREHQLQASHSLSTEHAKVHDAWAFTSTKSGRCKQNEWTGAPSFSCTFDAKGLRHLATFKSKSCDATSALLCLLFVLSAPFFLIPLCSPQTRSMHVDVNWTTITVARSARPPARIAPVQVFRRR